MNSEHSPELNGKPERLTFTRQEACVALGVSLTTLWRLEARGLIKAVPYFRTKIYSRKELTRFLASGEAK
jgi:hypothetical protein